MHRLRHATYDDISAVLAVLNSAVAWLHQRGSDQWGGIPWHADELLPDLHTGSLYLAETVDRIPIATMSLNDTPDEDFWTPDDDPHAALYLRHLAVDRRAAGHGIGAWMLHQATRRAADDRKNWLRLDAWKTNARLHTYYLDHGFEHVRTVDVSGRNSGALFQRPTAVRPAVTVTPARTEASPPLRIHGADQRKQD
ncbi:GNAT family N-acetyltransferase [Actinoplanes oblitus]|uniref:GNAT family N-acetyltransferase n=1 Tax=Actinoplanes oblitus TaxID=3040509 RepID=A0ABY8WQH2_9ACTN|nr:GNAT family N-acetyltransferase [Actinoplanes oblitus]WIN00106.1 GNAT family N-acetyltransferase [Actinoplanes oblitus]